MSQSAEVTRLVALIDRLEALVERSGLSELELEAGGTSVTLRMPAAFATAAATVTVEDGPSEPPLPEEPARPRGAHAIVAPLTGVYYRSPSPGAEPYVREGGPVSAGQVIGLIEAMKLFNEIKSDVSGTVRHMAVGDGELVKVRQTLIEVDPA
jgi:acetyl-CoA carboxylase biotin carboxyl carrier protein